jgi:hypothetical protein
MCWERDSANQVNRGHGFRCYSFIMPLMSRIGQTHAVYSLHALTSHSSLGVETVNFEAELRIGELILSLIQCMQSHSVSSDTI